MASDAGPALLLRPRNEPSRVVIKGTHWTAYVPYAARWPVEVHLVPHRDVPDLVPLLQVQDNVEPATDIAREPGQNRAGFQKAGGFEGCLVVSPISLFASASLSKPSGFFVFQWRFSPQSRW